MKLRNSVALFFVMIITARGCFAGAFGKKLTYLCKGAFVHVLNQKCPNVMSYICPATEQDKQLRLFGYNLGIEYHAHADKNVIKPENRVILFLHPWGMMGVPNKKHAHLLKLYDVLPGDVVTFNFPDGVWRSPLPVWYSSLGQLSDVLPAIYALNYAYENFDVQAIDLFGYSRGGAVAVNMLGVLNDKGNQYDSTLEQIGIDRVRRQQLITLIEKGSIVLNCPLIDGNVTLNEYSKVIQFFAKTFTNYKHDGLQALHSSGQLTDRKFNTLLHFQHNDQRITNLKESDLYNSFARINPAGTYLLMGKDGGHIHTHDTLSKAVHLFYRQVGAAYDVKQVENYEIGCKKNKTSWGKLLQPSIAESEQIITSIHRSS